MDSRRLLFVALAFIAVISVLGLFSMMHASRTSFAWGNVYDNSNNYRNCYCHNGIYSFVQPGGEGTGIYGPGVRFLGQRLQGQCAYDCKSMGYAASYWVDPEHRNPVWPRYW